MSALDKVQTQTRIRTGLIAACLMVLYAEWIFPLMHIPHITQVYMPEPFLLAIFSFVLIDYLNIGHWLGWSAKLLASLAIVAVFFHQTHLLDGQFWSAYADAAVNDWQYVLQGNFVQWSAENRTISLFIGWAIIINAVNYLTIRHQWSGWFSIVTIMYLLLLNMFGGIDTSTGIIRALCAALILMSINHLPRIERQFGAVFAAGGVPARWMASMAALIAVAVFGGMWQAAAETRNPEPLAWKMEQWIEQMSRMTQIDLNQNTIDNSVAQAGISGYSPGDVTLGGTIIPQDRIVFTAVTDRVTYWRGNIKKRYDGEGWKQEPVPVSEEQHAATKFALFSPGSEEKTIVQEVLLEPGTASLFDNTLLAGGPIAGIDSMVGESGRLYGEEKAVYDEQSARYYAGQMEGSDALSYYKIRVLPPELAWQESLTDAELKSYLQLPSTVTERVRKLASSVAGSIADDAGKAAAIEAHLRANYGYSLDISAMPDETQDFVDHFLFEQKFGYCDYFSTAMAVMLRSVGIPARWVQGFAPGETHIRSDGRYAVTVKALHAHSWVEAYIDGAGWVAFEPTPAYERESAEPVHTDEAARLTPQNADRSEPDWRGVLSGMAMLAAENKEMNRLWNEWQANIRQNSGVHALIVAAVCVTGLGMIALVVFRLLRKELAYRKITRRIRRINSSAPPEEAEAALEQLWGRLFREYGAIMPGQTLREYVNCLQLNDEAHRRTFIGLAALHESLRFDRQRPNS